MYSEKLMLPPAWDNMRCVCARYSILCLLKGKSIYPFLVPVNSFCCLINLGIGSSVVSYYV